MFSLVFDYTVHKPLRNIICSKVTEKQNGIKKKKTQALSAAHVWLQHSTYYFSAERLTYSLRKGASLDKNIHVL